MTRTSTLLAALLACGGCISVPQTHRYTLAQAEPSEVETVSTRSGPQIAVEELRIDAAYADDQIVYRPSPVQLEHYHYHRWGGPPSQLVTDYLREAYARSGCFADVTETLRPGTEAVLTGRVTALEEVDVSESEWRGRVAAQLQLLEPDSGEVIWTARYRREEPLSDQSPAGLARGLSRALGDIVDESLPAIAEALSDAESPPACGPGAAPVTAAR